MVRLHAILFGVAAAVVIQSNMNQKINDGDQIYANLSSVASTEVVQLLNAFTDTLLYPEAAGVNDASQTMRTVSNKMDLRTASRLMDVKGIPQDVTHLVQTVSDGDAVPQFDEASLDKARIALNDLVEKAWIDLDNTIFRCKGFQDMNRANYDQVQADQSRLVEQIQDLERLQSAAQNGIQETSRLIDEQKERMSTEETLYTAESQRNKADLRIKQNDLDVFQFILVYTQCKGATSLAQMKSRICETRSGRKTILFDDAEIASKYKKILTPRTKRSIDMILRSVEAGHSSFLQAPSKNSTTFLPPLTDEKEVPVVGADAKPCLEIGDGGGEDACMKSCGPDPPDCALLHDKLSLMWGEYKDQVDELTMEMLKNKENWEMLQYNINAQIKLLTVKRGELQEHLGEVGSKLQGDRQELDEKFNQKRKLDHQYEETMHKCKLRIQWILYQDMCAIKVVRNAVLENSTTCPSGNIQDCVLENWKKQECNVPCDDSCEPSKPFQCGGWATMTRSVIAEPDLCGIKCPGVEKQIRCGQYKCPVDCALSSWSGWSSCTTECGGGQRAHTRSILTKPKNGGKACDNVQEVESCNTGSCNRNCRLHRWTSWSPCSVACAGGFQERARHVLIPTRGQGRCPKADSHFRYRERRCNTQACIGDEICIAVQDLVVAVDGSGSLQESGFKVLKEYTNELLAKYQSQYFGQPAMKIGLVLFGNGVIMPDGKTVSPALPMCKLTDNIKTVQTAVEALPFKKGFTNMAQAFSMAERMFVTGQRQDAQQSVLLITDGKPSFAYQTNEMVEQLDDKNIMRYFVVVNSDGPASDVMKQMHLWASHPWETNLIHVPGLLMLESDMGLWAQNALVKFCPQAYSPQQAQHEEKIVGYAHVKDSAWCGDRGYLLTTKANDAESCAALAIGAGCQDFITGTYFRRGWCYCGSMKVNKEQWDKWQGDRVDPECPTGWQSSMLYDFWAVQNVDR